MDGPSACRDDEFDEVISLINSEFRAGTDQDIRTDYPLVFNRAGLEYMRVVRVDGRVVAHVPVAPREVRTGGDGFTIGIISPTVTHPGYRRRGYATACLRDCVRIMQERGWPVSVLWTQVRTFPFYQNSGWEAAGSQGWAYRLDSSDASRFERGSYDVVPYDSENGDHLEAVGRFHDAEAHRIVRTRQELGALLSLPKIRVLLAVRSGTAAGYLVVGEAVNKPGLLEGGGAPDALEALVVDVLSGLGPEDTIQAQAPLSSAPLGRLMESAMRDGRSPIEEAAGAGFQMIRVNSLERLLHGMEGHLRARSEGVRGSVGLECSDSGEAVTIELDDGDARITAARSKDSLTLSRRQLAALIFGHHASVGPPPVPRGRSEILDRLFPFYFPVWALDRS